MTQRRVTATEQLSKVIDALQLGKKTGILTVERGEGDRLVEGTLVFVLGEVVQAAIGSYVGKDATTILFSWQACCFCFVPALPEDITQQFLPTSRSRTVPNKVPENTYKPSYGTQQTEPAFQDDMSRRPLIIVPYKDSMDGILRILEQQGFSRTHRHLFLMIDGRRSIRALANLIRRTPDETATLLAEMKQAGLIRL
jgi:Domain of unknown function (DUF4388)